MSYGSTKTGGCGCSGIQHIGRVAPAGLGASPDGVGAYSGPPLFGSVSGNVFGDALIGAVVAYFAHPKGGDPKRWAALGGAVVALAGTVGLIGVVGMAVWSHGKGD